MVEEKNQNRMIAKALKQWAVTYNNYRLPDPYSDSGWISVLTNPDDNTPFYQSMKDSLNGYGISAKQANLIYPGEKARVYQKISGRSDHDGAYIAALPDTHWYHIFSNVPGNDSANSVLAPNHEFYHDAGYFENSNGELEFAYIADSAPNTHFNAYDTRKSGIQSLTVGKTAIPMLSLFSRGGCIKSSPMKIELDQMLVKC